ncbi:MAG: hypothetical protein ACPHCJ_00190 [Oceanococcaceae bacterium]
MSPQQPSQHEPIRPDDPEVARRNVRTALFLAALALSFFAAFFVVMSR